MKFSLCYFFQTNVLLEQGPQKLETYDTILIKMGQITWCLKNISVLLIFMVRDKSQSQRYVEETIIN